MKTYNVQMLEVHRQDVLIEGESPQHALMRVEEGEGDQQELHYDYTLDSSDWKVFEVK